MSSFHNMVRLVRGAVHLLVHSGPLAVLLQTRAVLRGAGLRRRAFSLPVAASDVLDADWTGQRDEPPSRHRHVSAKLTISWVLPPAGLGSGGHNTIFRFVRYLEQRGHACRLYFYDPLHSISLRKQIQFVRAGFEPMAAPVLAYSRDLQDADVLFATGWQTAYPVFNQRTSARKFYLVQDFEPSFYAVGTESVLAENTYRFNLHGIAAGRWLSDRLSKGYGMRCDYFDFGSDPFVYVNQGIPNRRGVVFYARPVTPRRGFELGVLALELFHRAHPDVGIHMVGWDVADYKIPFPFTNHGIVPPRQLNAVYNQCAVGLVLSFTNLSLLPLELLSSGCIPVVNDAPSNRLVTDSQLIRYAPPNPQALADALGHVVSDPDLDAHAREGSRSVASLSWDDAGSKIENILLRELRE